MKKIPVGEQHQPSRSILDTRGFTHLSFFCSTAGTGAGLALSSKIGPARAADDAQPSMKSVNKEGTIKRFLVILGVVAALAVPVSAQAVTTVQRVTFDATFLLCNGDLIHVSGPLLVTFSTTTTPSGGLIFAIHFQPQGVTGVDLTTGTVFEATGLTRELFVVSPPGGITETCVNQFHIQATSGAQSFIVTELIHITVNPDGTLRVFFDNFSATC